MLKNIKWNNMQCKILKNKRISIKYKRIGTVE